MNENSRSELAAADTVRLALEDFVYDNPDLERFEAILDTFNPFVAMRWTRQEIRHSAFLRWLLDPSETHRLGAYFLSAFLKRIAHRLPTGGLSVVSVDAWDLSKAVVQQEWRGIDLLIQDDANRFVAVIENKTDSAEHSDQLRRYREDIERHFPRYMAMFVYLTPGGEQPSDEAYTAITYTEVVEILEEALRRRGTQLEADVRTFLHHYAEMVRRYIVEDSEIQKLCRTIYERHREALDVLFEQRPDRASDIAGRLLGLVSKQPTLIADHSIKSYIRFIPRSWDFLPPVGDGWTPTKRMVLFQFYNGEEIWLSITLGPGERSLRDRIYETLREHPKVFNRAAQRLYPQWWTFHSEKWIRRKQYREADPEELQAELEQRFDHFLAHQLPAMDEVFRTLKE